MSTITGSNGDTTGTLVSVTDSKPGASLTDASVTVNPASDKASSYTVPVSTLTANRVLTLGTAGSPIDKSVVQVIRRDRTAHTYTVNDDAATPLLVFASGPSTAQGASFYWDATSSHYKFLSFYYVS